MAGQRLDIMELLQLIQLKNKGMSNRKVASFLGISRNTVNSYVKIFNDHKLSYEDLQKLTENDLKELFPDSDYKDTARHEELCKLFPDFKKELTKPGCTLQTLWNEYLTKHPNGYRYTQFAGYYKQWNNIGKASGILSHKAAEKMFVDFAGKKFPYLDAQTGEIKQAEVFVAILPCSQYTYVQAVESQKREDFIACLNGCLQWLQGAPQAIVSDNLKSAVSKGHKYAPLINKTLKALAIHYNCVIDQARPYHPQDKALVEGAVKLVYQRIYYPLSKLTFFSIKQLNEAISKQLVQYNEQYCFQTSKITRKQRFLETEQAYLGPLPQGQYLLRNYKRAKVQKIGHVFISEDKNYYSVPHRYIGQQVEVQYDADIIEIFFNRQRVASHKRSYKAGHYNTIKDHMPSSHQAYSDWNPEFFSKKAEKIGKSATEYIVRLMAQYTYPELGYKQAQGILALIKTYPKKRIEDACKRALSHHKSSYHTIEKILKNNMDQQEGFGITEENKTPDHENVRGAGNYC